ncbi:hypothetical protein ACHAWF_010259 [Thalassiosira exigua]
MARLTPKKATTKTGAKKATSPCKGRDYKKGNVLRLNNKQTKPDSGRGGEVDFNELTHAITGGTHKMFQGLKICDNDANDGDVMTVCLLKNARGKKMRAPMMIKVKKSEVRELTSDDMIESTNDLCGELEDKAFVNYEQGKWECPLCKKMNGNDAGYCDNEVVKPDGKKNRCGGTKKCDMKSWEGCFAKAKVTWNCGICTSPNPTEVDKCKSCNAVRNI